METSDTIEKIGSFDWFDSTVHYAAITDRGRVRKANEDSFLILEDEAYFAVADGAGGHENGARASFLTVSEIETYLKAEVSTRNELLNLVALFRFCVFKKCTERKTNFVIYLPEVRNIRANRNIVGIIKISITKNAKYIRMHTKSKVICHIEAISSVQTYCFGTVTRIWICYIQRYGSSKSMSVTNSKTWIDTIGFSIS